MKQQQSFSMYVSVYIRIRIKKNSSIFTLVERFQVTQLDCKSLSAKNERVYWCCCFYIFAIVIFVFTLLFYLFSNTFRLQRNSTQVNSRMVSGTIYVEWLWVYVQLRFPVDSSYFCCCCCCFFFLFWLLVCEFLCVLFFSCVVPFLSSLCCFISALLNDQENECNRNTLTVFFLYFFIIFFMLCFILCFKCDAA